MRPSPECGKLQERWPRFFSVHYTGENKERNQTQEEGTQRLKTIISQTPSESQLEDSTPDTGAGAELRDLNTEPASGDVQKGFVIVGVTVAS